MWEKINNYKYSLGQLKFLLWISIIAFVLYGVDFLYGLFNFDILWMKGFFTVAAFLVFSSCRTKIKNNDYRTA